jgi:hypothetical protein
VDPPASDGPSARRALFDSPIGAVMPEALVAGPPEPMALHWRVTANAVQRDLPAQATSGTDPVRASWTRRIAAARLAACDGLLVG